MQEMDSTDELFALTVVAVAGLCFLQAAVQNNPGTIQEKRE